MENLLPILIIGGIYFYNVYSKYKEEQKKHQKRMQKPQSRGSQQSYKKTQPAYKKSSPPPTYKARPAFQVESPRMDENITRKAKRPNITTEIEAAREEIQEINESLPKLDLEVVELNEPGKEVQNELEYSFDLRDAVIKSAILHRPKI